MQWFRIHYQKENEMIRIRDEKGLQASSEWMGAEGGGRNRGDFPSLSRCFCECRRSRSSWILEGEIPKIVRETRTTYLFNSSLNDSKLDFRFSRSFFNFYHSTNIVHLCKSKFRSLLVYSPEEPWEQPLQPVPRHCSSLFAVGDCHDGMTSRFSCSMTMSLGWTDRIFLDRLAFLHANQDWRLHLWRRSCCFYSLVRRTQRRILSRLLPVHWLRSSHAYLRVPFAKDWHVRSPQRHLGRRLAVYFHLRTKRETGNRNGCA